MRNFDERSSPSAREPFLSPRSRTPSAPLSNLTNSPPLSILAYCLASISMTVINKFCVSGANWNMNFLYLAIQVYLPLEILYWIWLRMVVFGLHHCNYDLQASRSDQEPRGFRRKEGETMWVGISTKAGRKLIMPRVPNLSSPRRYDLYQYQSTPIPFGSRLHHFQELDHHCHCIRRGSMVRRKRFCFGTFLVWTHGIELRGSCMGRYPTRPVWKR